MMSLRYLDSSSIETVSDALSKTATRSRELNVATAFLTVAGARQILELRELLGGPRMRQQVRVLVGTWLGVTEPSALRQLRRAKGIDLRIAKTPGFHVKHVSFRGSKALTAYTGSANFTSKGLGGQGELVVEITEKLGSSTDSIERDVFRHLWADGYPDAMTEEVIAAYEKRWKTPRFLREDGPRAGKSLLAQFGQRAVRTSAPTQDGSVLWFPIEGSLTEATVEALKAEGGGLRSDFIGFPSKGTFERIRKGTRQIWLLDLRGRPGDRTLELWRVIGEPLERPTESDGRYFAILDPERREIPLTEGNRKALKEMGLVRRVDSLAATVRTLRPGAQSMVSRLLELSRPKSQRQPLHSRA